jgi:hypothetical protein
VTHSGRSGGRRRGAVGVRLAVPLSPRSGGPGERKFRPDDYAPILVLADRRAERADQREPRIVA